VPARELTIAGLPATLTLPDGAARGGVVPLHPASDGSRRQPLFEHLTKTLVPRGVAVLAYDRRPSPDGSDVPFEVQADDALAALRELQAEVGEVPLGLWAWSQGAWAASLAATRSPDVAFLVLLAASGVSPAEQMRYGTAEHLRRHGHGDDQALHELAELRAALEDAYRDPVRRGDAQAVIDRYSDRPWFELAYVPRALGELGDWADLDFDPAPILARVRCPVLLFYGEEDEWTPIEPSLVAWERAPADVTVVRLAGTDHAPTLGGAISPDYTAALVAWVERRLAAG
jgi:uncharacterized protein